MALKWRITTPSGKRKWLQGFGRPQPGPDESIVWDSLIHEDDRRMVMGRVQRCLNSEGPYVSEHRMLRADGCTVWVEGRGDTVERSADGTPSRMLGSMIDITARRQAEDALPA